MPAASDRGEGRQPRSNVTGEVNAYREAIVRLTVRGSEGAEESFEAVLDTGFTGALTLPSNLIQMLGFPLRRRGRALLADGSESVFDTYEATVLWDGQPRRISVDAVDTDPQDKRPRDEAIEGASSDAGGGCTVHEG